MTSAEAKQHKAMNREDAERDCAEEGRKTKVVGRETARERESDRERKREKEKGREAENEDRVERESLLRGRRGGGCVEVDAHPSAGRWTYFQI